MKRKENKCNKWKRFEEIYEEKCEEENVKIARMRCIPNGITKSK